MIVLQSADPTELPPADAPAVEVPDLMTVERVVPIQDNAYCAIESGLVGGEPVVVKRYRGEDATLASREADAIEWIAEQVQERPGWMAARLIRFEPEQNLLVMERLPGRQLSVLVRHAAHDVRLRERLNAGMQRLGELLASLRAATAQPGVEPSPFLLEYLAYVSAGLESLPAVGPTLFHGTGLSAITLWQELVRSGDAPSWSHGDMVLRNVMMSGDRIGLIDLANTNPRAHLLNDVYALEIAMESTIGSPDLRAELRSSFRRGLGPLDFPPAVHRFYWELNRRRWIYLLLHSRHPATVARGIWSMRRVRRPLDPRCGVWPPLPVR